MALGNLGIPLGNGTYAPLVETVTTVVAATQAAYDAFYLVDTTGGTFAVTAPTPATGRRWGLKWTAGAVAPTLLGTYNGSTPTLTTLDQAMLFISDGVRWYREVRPVLAQMPDYPAVSDTRYPLATQTPTIEELIVNSTTPDLTATGSGPLFVVPFAMEIVAAEYVNWNAGITASDTDYWTIDLRYYRAGDTVGVAFATKTTKVTGGEVIAQRKAWNWDTVTFDATKRQLQKDDAVGIVGTKTGAPANFSNGRISMRYRPL